MNQVYKFELARRLSNTTFDLEEISNITPYRNDILPINNERADKVVEYVRDTMVQEHSHAFVCLTGLKRFDVNKEYPRSEEYSYEFDRRTLVITSTQAGYLGYNMVTYRIGGSVCIMLPDHRTDRDIPESGTFLTDMYPLLLAFLSALHWENGNEFIYHYVEVTNSCA